MTAHEEYQPSRDDICVVDAVPGMLPCGIAVQAYVTFQFSTHGPPLAAASSVPQAF